MNRLTYLPLIAFEDGSLTSLSTYAFVHVSESAVGIDTFVSLCEFTFRSAVGLFVPSNLIYSVSDSAVVKPSVLELVEYAVTLVVYLPPFVRPNLSTILYILYMWKYFHLVSLGY
jgi:hypothetical protein